MEVVSLDALSGQEHCHKDILQDTTVDIMADLEDRMELEQLKKAKAQLEENELQLIIKIYYENKSEHQLENETGISQSTINDRKHRILFKLLKIMKNEK
jgi:DNA-directed RNA polymerase specialized sigma subunit